MAIEFHEKKKEYVDNTGQEIQKGLLKRTLVKQNITNNIDSSYLRHKKVFTLGEIQGPITISRQDLSGKYVEKFIEINQESIGFNKEGLEKIYKLGENILKDYKVDSYISEEFLVDTIFDWCIKKYTEGLQLSLSDFLIKECNASINYNDIYIPILFLESDKEFGIGNTRFIYLTEQYISQLSMKIEESKRIRFIEGWKNYCGQLLAVCRINAEKIKGIELAKEQVTLSVDVLRMLSPTVEYPDFKIYFDTDFRNVHQTKSEILVQPIHQLEDINANHIIKPSPFIINKVAWDILCQGGLEVIHNFIIRTTYKKTELEALVYNAIRNFSRAVANHDLHERIVQIYSVLESLLLPDDNALIIESVAKYLPRLIAKETEIRKKIIETIKDLYKVRSSMIHHAKRKEMDLNSLRFLQICTRTLIIQLIKLSRVKTSKKEILSEIDEILLSA